MNIWEHFGSHPTHMKLHQFGGMRKVSGYWLDELGT